MTELSRRRWAILSTALALALACWTFSSVFSRSRHVNELVVDLIGIVSFLFAVLASYLLYRLRPRLKFRIFGAATILLAVLLCIEFVGGSLWLTLDKVARYWQTR